MRMPRTAEEAAANGARFLDKKVPGWWEDVDVDTLDLSSVCCCILGQIALPDIELLEGEPDDSFHALLDGGKGLGEPLRRRYHIRPLGLTMEEQCWFGFDDCFATEDAWRAEIELRRSLYPEEV